MVGWAFGSRAPPNPRRQETDAAYRTFLFAPFIPFVVLFCHILETLDTTDIQRLEDFIRPLQELKSKPESVEKLQRLCQVLLDIAKLYVKAKRQIEQGVVSMLPVSSEVDMYLHQLGMLSSDMPLDSGMVDPMLGDPNMAAHLGDWFSGNRYMVGLLEDDLMNWSEIP